MKIIMYDVCVYYALVLLFLSLQLKMVFGKALSWNWAGKFQVGVARDLEALWFMNLGLVTK